MDDLILTPADVRRLLARRIRDARKRRGWTRRLVGTLVQDGRQTWFAWDEDYDGPELSPYALPRTTASLHEHRPKPGVPIPVGDRATSDAPISSDWRMERASPRGGPKRSSTR